MDFSQYKTLLDTSLASAPLAILIWLMVKKNSLPSHKALPIAAFLMYVLMIVYFDRGLTEIHALAIQGFLTAWTPILIIWGAILLFKTMEKTGAMDSIRAWLNNLTQNTVAQLMIVGWAFPFLIEGASGFGTPAAIAAPLLVGLGFPAIRVAILTLIMNSVPVSFGAVGTPTWFGFSSLGLSEAEILSIGFKSSLINSGAAFVIPWIALSFIVDIRSLKRNSIFIILSILATIIPYCIVAQFNYEFPAIVGGFIGLIVSSVLAKFNIGLATDPQDTGINEAAHQKENTAKKPADVAESPSLKTLLKASFALWGTLLILIITRIPDLGIKGLLNIEAPFVEFSLGSLGIFTLSPALVIGLQNILNTGFDWSHKLLYVPSLVPFCIVALMCFLLYKSPRNEVADVFKDTTKRLYFPAIALFAALIFVKFMMSGGSNSPVNLLGNLFTKLAGEQWTYFSAYLGALGSFFSGSNTVSNLTFAGIQDSIAANMGLERNLILALQSVGGAMGNMVCINNIVAVCSILVLENKEGYILKRTAVVMLIYGIIAAILSNFV